MDYRLGPEYISLLIGSNSSASAASPESKKRCLHDIKNQLPRSAGRAASTRWNRRSWIDRAVGRFVELSVAATEAPALAVDTAAAMESSILVLPAEVTPDASLPGVVGFEGSQSPSVIDDESIVANDAPHRAMSRSLLSSWNQA